MYPPLWTRRKETHVEQIDLSIQILCSCSILLQIHLKEVKENNNDPFPAHYFSFHGKGSP